MSEDWVSGKFSSNTQIGRCYDIDIKSEYKNSDDIWKYHKIENLEPLSTRKYRNNGYIPGVNNKGKSYTTKGCVGSYQVSGYTRADGTEVKGYTRACGASRAEARL